MRTSFQPTLSLTNRIASLMQAKLSYLILTHFLLGLQLLPAQLKSLDQSPWFGFFAGYSARKFRIGMASTGEIRLTPLGDNKEPIHRALDIPIMPMIEESLPDGRVISHPIDPESLRSENAPTAELGKVIVLGKIASGAAFELTFEQERGMLLLGGRMLDGDTLKNPHTITFQVGFSNPYPYSRSKLNEKSVKDFHKKLKRDCIELKWADNKTRTIAIINESAENPTPLDGILPGISEAKVDICSFAGTGFTFFAAPNSGITLNPKPLETLPGGLSLIQGFSFVWRSDSSKDPTGKAKFAISVK